MNMKKTSFMLSAISSALLMASTAMAADTMLASVSSNGLIAGNDASSSPAVSGNGRYVVFDTSATTLGPSSNGQQQILRKDLLTGAIENVSVSSAEVLGTQYSFGASINDDGQRVVFSTYANNFDGLPHIYSDVAVRDVANGTTTVISRNSAGQVLNGSSDQASISGNGQVIAFVSVATNLIANDTNGVSDIFVKDLQSGSIERISVSTGGLQANAGSIKPSISADGRYVAFASAASNLVSGDTNGQYDIYVHDRQLRTTRLVSLNNNGVIGDKKSDQPTISDDGRYIAFHSFSTNLDTSITTRSFNIFVRDLINGKTKLISRASNGDHATSISINAKISGDGRFVSYITRATNIATPDNNTGYDIVVYDQITNHSEFATVNTAGQQVNSAISFIHDINKDGSTVVFASGASNLSSIATANIVDVFTRHRDLNINPVANAGSYAPIECSGTTTPVQLNGNGSSDA
ncbi:MAG: hypothetical protein OEX19_15510, partial [Gammaproteobacteria bacterium]|nr:hypothetical protein [Gammaproteobacteria bacterium]